MSIEKVLCLRPFGECVEAVSVCVWAIGHPH